TARSAGGCRAGRREAAGLSRRGAQRSEAPQEAAATRKNFTMEAELSTAFFARADFYMIKEDYSSCG
ncbi:MAG: hypothetical protein J5615_10925, partial [Fibrobacter sp.]|nr:hypothetical protein [Fibrobacter sp.]